MLYLDSSALVKLVVAEAETSALERHVAGGDRVASCALAHVEMIRATSHRAADVAAARQMLTDLDLIDVSWPILEAAASFDARALRTLDAIHVASALSLGEALSELITYDRRMAEAAEALGVPVGSPT